MKYLSFIDPDRGGFGEIFPEVELVKIYSDIVHQDIQ